MKYSFEKVINGLLTYIDSEIYGGMNDVQELVARLALARIINNQGSIKTYLMNNGMIRTFGIIDDEGMVDIENLARDLKNEISRKEKLTISIPMFGKMTFKPNDVNVLFKTITGQELN